MLKNVVGAPVRGDDLFGRDAFIELLWNKLKVTNVLLAAPRRFGKTSIMYHLYDHPRHNFRVVHLDLERIQEPVNFIIELLEQVKKNSFLSNIITDPIKKLGSFFEEHIQSFGLDVAGYGFKLELKKRIKDDWQDFADVILDRLKNSDEKVLFIFDELAYMLEHFEENNISLNEIKSFLNWFRNFRQAPDMSITNCAFLLGSSIGLDQYLANRNISAVMNDLERIQLEAFTTEQAKTFLSDLCKGENFKLSSRSRNKMLELIGPPIPYFIQVFFSELLKVNRIRNKKITPKVVEEIYFEEILGVNSKGYFIHYYERLHHYSKNHERLAKIFLKQLCTNEALPKKHLQNLYEKEMHRFDVDDFNLLISNLENDYYIKFNSTDQSYNFASNILKDWWRRYYGL